MAFTNAWNESTPAGSAQANTLDTIIQTLKLDLRQRLDEVLGEAGRWDDDPIIEGTVLKSIKTLVTELASKTTVTGLTSGKLIQATGGGSIGDATLTNAQLNALNALIGLSNLSTTDANGDPMTLNVGVNGAGTYVISMISNAFGSSPARQRISINGVAYAYNNTPLNVFDATLTVVAAVGASQDIVGDFTTGGSNGSHRLIARRII